MAGFGDLRSDSDWTALFEEQANRWACFGCSQPTLIVYCTDRGAVQPGRVFECPHNRYAPHAGSDRCPHLTPIPGISELWD